MENDVTNDFNFDLPKNKSNVIKVIGVGGGGSNAINYMFSQGINGVDFVVTNTDAQALMESPVPTKIQLGASLTEGLGAGANPEVGALAAQESKVELETLLHTRTKMVFITAGMGGGTGTGAAPIIAKMAKDLDILTVGIVTMPFQFEGKIRLEQAQEGLEKIKKTVDALIVINNNKLRMVYGNLGFKAGFSKADEVLATAARGIAEVITHHYTQNIDLKDAKTVLTNSGTAIMGSGSASGSNRALEAIENALDSPLLNDNKITGCKNVLLLIVSGSEEITIDEIGEINDFIQAEAGNHTNIIMGVGEDETLGNAVAVTVIATGFGAEQQLEIVNTEAKKIIHSLEDEQKVEQDLTEKEVDIEPQPLDAFEAPNEKEKTEPSMDDSFAEEDEMLAHEIMNMEVVYEIIEAEPQVIAPEEEDSFINDQEENALTSQDAEKILEDELTPINEQPIEEMDESDLIAEMNTPSVVDKIEYNLIDQEKDEPSQNQVEELKYDTFGKIEEETEHQFVETALFNLEPNDVEEFIVKTETETESENDPEEFVFNEISSKELSDIVVNDPEHVLDEESQIAMDFEKPFENVFEIKETTVAENKQRLDSDSHDSQEETFDFEEHAIEFELKTSSTPEEAPQSGQETENQPISSEEKHTIEESDESNPFDQPIEESFSKNNEIRKEQLKKFNYKFKYQLQRIDELENKPAFERKGMDLSEKEPPPASRTSLNEDEQSGLHLRSNNSFLHDSVD